MQVTTFTQSILLKASRTFFTAVVLITISFSSWAQLTQGQLTTKPLSINQVAEKSVNGKQVTNQVNRKKLARNSMKRQPAASTQADTMHTELTGFQAEVLIPGANHIVKNKISDVPEIIKFRPGSEIDHASFNDWAHKNLKLSADYDFNKMRQDSDINSGYTFHRYQQTYKGVPIEGAQYIVNAKGGKISLMTGQIFSKLNVDANPKLTEAEALAKALDHVGAQKYAWQDASLEKFRKQIKDDTSATYFPKGELVIAPVNGEFTETNLRLAYKFEINSVIPYDVKMVYVDAINGSIINEESEIEEDKDIPGVAYTVYSGKQNITCSYNGFSEEFSLGESSRGKGNGIYTYDYNHHSDNVSSFYWLLTNNDESSNGIFGSLFKPDTLADAHWGAEKTYDFYLSTFNRNSFDNKGSKIISLVHWGTDVDNAQFNGELMEYGDGENGKSPFTSLDIVGHELTHAVTKYSAGLIYRKESGALNEAFSDMMGKSIDFAYGTNPNWEYTFDGEVARDMSDPNAEKKPCAYNGNYYLSTNECVPTGGKTGNDWCGVHRNSLVADYWFFLLCIGNNGQVDNGFTPSAPLYYVKAIGRQKAQAIAYNTLLNLTPNSGFWAARYVSVEEAGMLYGSQEQISVADAWFAVNVGPSYSPPITPRSPDPPLNSDAYSIARDEYGNSYVAGSFSGTMTLGNYTLVGPDDSDLAEFVAKFDTSGNVLWAVKGGGYYGASATGICVDNRGNSYVTGYFNAAGIFYGTGGGGATDTVAFPTLDDDLYALYMFIIKYDSAGNIIYGLRGGGSSVNYGGFTEGLAVTCTNNDTCYVTGAYYGYEPFGSLTLAENTDAGSGEDLTFIAMVSGGQYQQATNINSEEGGSSSQAIARDNNGNLYVGGYFNGPQQYGSGSFNSVGIEDAYILKLNSGLGFIWAQTAGGTSVNAINGIATSNQNDVIITGTCTSPATFGTFTIDSTGGGFIAKLNSQGNFIWAENTVSADPISATIDSSGNSYLTGTKLVQEFDTAGNSLWIDNATGGFINGNSITTDNSSVAITGQFADSYTYNGNTVTVVGEQFFLQTIPIPSLGILNADSFVCASSPLSLDFEAIGNFYSDNVFTAEVSTSSNFSSYITMGTKTTSAESDTMQINLSSLQKEVYYYMRIVSSDPYASIAGGDLYEFKVKNNPVISITQGDTVRTCSGSALLSVTSNPEYNYQWYFDSLPIIGYNSDTMTTPLAGNYSVQAFYGELLPDPDGTASSITVINNYTCLATASVVVISKTLNVDSGVVKLPCDSIYVTLHASGSDSLYSWSPSEGLNVTTGPTVLANPTVTTTYTVTAIFKGGCKIDTPIVVKVPAPPFAIPGGGATDSSITANWNTYNGATSYILDVSTSINFTGFVKGFDSLYTGNDTTYIVNGLSPSTKYYYRIRAVGNCGISSFSDTITYSTASAGCKAPTITPGGPTTFCEDGNVSLDAGGGWASYLWSNGETTETIKVTEEGNYYCAVTLDSCSKVSDTVTVTVIPSVVPSVSIVSSNSNPICSGTSVQFTATPTNGGTPVYQWLVNGKNAGTNSFTFTITTLSNNDQVTVSMVSSALCASPDTVQSNTITTSVNNSVTPSVSIAATGSDTICSGISVIFTATSINDGTSPSYQWKVNGNDAGTNSASFISGTLSNEDQVSVTMTSNAACASPATANSNTITMTVNTPVTPSISITANTGDTICSGTNVIFTATAVNGGSSPSYQWKLNGNDVGTSSASYSNSSLDNGDAVTVTLTSSIACVTSSTAGSNTINITISSSVAPSVSIVASADTVCSGTDVTFTATPVNGGTAPSYQWTVNSIDAGTNSASFSSTLNNGDEVAVTLTSSSGCATPSTAGSNNITMTVNNSVIPSVSIVSNVDTICSGTSVTFTATTVNGGTTPLYQWKVNGNDVGTNSASFNSSSLNNGDEVSVSMTSDAPCASPSSVGSNTITMTVNNNVTPSVSIVAVGGNTTCSGTSVTFNATPLNGGATPLYQWMVNGMGAGTNNASFSTSTLNNSDQVSVSMTSDAACASPATVISDTITMTVNNAVTPSVSILANHSDTICSGTSVTFTATPVNGGTTPSYQWKVNGTDAGTNSASFNTNTLSNGGQVTVNMTSNATCASPATTNSNTITMTVNTSVTPSVSITTSPSNTICSGASVMFTATPMNGGTSPSYQWTLNGSNVGAGGTSYSNISLANGDNVSVVLTSDATCATTNTADGNVITMTVNSTPAAPVAIAGSDATNTQIKANWNASSGATTYYLDVSESNTFGSFVSGYDNLNIGNVTSKVVTGLTASTIYYFRVRDNNTCGTSGNSNIITYATLATSPCSDLNAGTVLPDSIVVCASFGTTLTNSGFAGGTLQWQVSGDNINWSNISGATDTSYTATSVTSNEYFRSIVVSSSCYNVSSNAALVSISTTPVITITNVTSSTATVTWTPYSSGQYNIGWSGAGIGSADAVTTGNYTITGLSPNENLQVIVTPSTPVCSGVNPGVANTRTLCGSPDILQAEAAASPAHAIILKWAAVTGATAYRVYYRDLFASALWSFVDTTGTGKTILVPLGAQTYAVYVVVKNCPSPGNIGEPSNVYYVTTNPPSTCLPIPVVNASANCPNQITVDMTGSPGPYLVTLRKISPAIAAGITVTVTTSSLNFNIGSSDVGTVWEVFARTSCSSTSSSDGSNISIVTVRAACPAVSNVVLSELTCTGFTASWNTNTCLGAGVTSYNILIKKNGTLNYSAYPVGNATDKEVTWLSAGSTYNVEVSAVSCNGSPSPYSLTDTITLPSCRMEENAEQNTGNTSAQNESVVVYPNPAQNQFFVDLGRTDRSEAIVKIELINELGQAMQTDVSIISNGHLNQVINVANDLASGVYFVRTTVGGNVYVSKIVLAH